MFQDSFIEQKIKFVRFQAISKQKTNQTKQKSKKYDVSKYVFVP